MALISSRIRYPIGTRNRVMKVPNNTPNASDRAIGFRNCAWRLPSNSTGAIPTKVVIEVRRIGRKRAIPESCTAFK